MHSEQVETVEAHEYVESEDDAGREPRMTNKLTPPTGTQFFVRQTVTFFDNFDIGSTTTSYGQLTWKADVYIYATCADPTDSDTFSKKGGVIYLVFCHYGSYTIYTNFPADVWKSLCFKLKAGVTPGLTPSLHLPATETGTPEGDNYNYKIDYQQAMQMFRNNGNEAFNFDASYQETFARIAAKQTGQRSPYIQFTVDTTKNSDAHRTTEIYGLSVFTINTPTRYLQFQRLFSMITPDGSFTRFGDITIKLDSIIYQ